MNYQFMPDLTIEEYAELKADIEQRGVMVPIEFDEFGNVLDGYHRLKICDELKIKEFPKVIRAGMTEAEKLTHARKLNIARRHLTQEQRRNLIREQLKETPEKSDRQIASELGVSNSTVSLQRKDLEDKGELCESHSSENSDNLFVLGRDGKKRRKKRDKLVSVFNPTKREEKALQNPDVIERLQEQNISITDASRKVLRAERQAAIAEQLSIPRTSSHVDIFTTDKKYRVIYADPPWEYNDKQDTEKLGGAIKHYPTMPLNDICALPVPADKNSVLFLWTTSPMLEDAFKVINSWGFKYKSSFIWDKISHAMGHYNSVRHEFLLVCTRGNCTPDVKRLFDSVIPIERTEHSKKPKEFREMIDTLYPIGERLEMFAREASEGWDIWGNMV